MDVQNEVKTGPLIIIRQWPFEGVTFGKGAAFITSQCPSGRYLYQVISHVTKIPYQVIYDQFYLTYNGQIVNANDVPVMPADTHSAYMTIHGRVLGGKGGFGSMLRAIGAQIEKTTNREACRDLSGRRLKDVNAEKRIKDWLSKKEDREKEAQKKKKEKLDRLLAEPRINFDDQEYFKLREEISEKVDDAIEYALKKKKTSAGTSAASSSSSSAPAAAAGSDKGESSGTVTATDDAKVVSELVTKEVVEIKNEPAKRKADADKPNPKKAKKTMWLGDLDEEDLSSDDD